MYYQLPKKIWNLWKSDLKARRNELENYQLMWKFENEEYDFEKNKSTILKIDSHLYA